MEEDQDAEEEEEEPLKLKGKREVLAAIQDSAHQPAPLGLQVVGPVMVRLGAEPGAKPQDLAGWKLPGFNRPAALGHEHEEGGR